MTILTSSCANRDIYPLTHGSKCTDRHHKHDHKVGKLYVDCNLLSITKVENNEGSSASFWSTVVFF